MENYFTQERFHTVYFHITGIIDFHCDRNNFSFGKTSFWYESYQSKRSTSTTQATEFFAGFSFGWILKKLIIRPSRRKQVPVSIPRSIRREHSK